MAFTLLRQILSPCDPEDFRHTHWGRRFLHLPGDPDKFAHLFSWEELNRVLRYHCAYPAVRPSFYDQEAFATNPRPTVELVQRRGPTDPTIDSSAYLDGGRLDVERLYACVKDGATIHLNHLTDISPILQAFAWEAERLLREEVQISAFATSGGKPALGPHAGWNHVLVLQIAGTKHWKVFEPPPSHRRQLSLDRVPDVEAHERALTADHKLVFDKELAAGELLHIPTGWYHQANPTGGDSLHLSVAFTVLDTRHVLTELTEVLLENPALRGGGLPRFGPREERVAYVARLKAAVLETLTPEFLDEVEARYSELRRPLPEFSFPLSVARARLERDETVVRWISPASPAFQDIGSSELVFTLLDREWSFTGQVDQLRRVLSFLGSHGEATVGQLRTAWGDGRDGPAALTDALASLLHSGLISIVRAA